MGFTGIDEMFNGISWDYVMDLIWFFMGFPRFYINGYIWCIPSGSQTCFFFLIHQQQFDDFQRTRPPF